MEDEIIQNRPIQEYFDSGEATSITMHDTYVPTGDKEVVTKEYADAGVSQLEKVALDDNVAGWRLLGQDPLNYQDIGDEAVDLSIQYNGEERSNGGSSGVYSLSAGFCTSAEGATSTALGQETTAVGTASTALGYYTQADSYASFAQGNRTTAKGTLAALLIAVNPTSITIDVEVGVLTGDTIYIEDDAYEGAPFRPCVVDVVSNGEGQAILTFSSGYDENYHSVGGVVGFGELLGTSAAGAYNRDTYGCIHSTGIGTGTADRRNVIEMYIDGTITAPEATDALIDARGDASLVTKGYFTANAASSELEKLDEGSGEGWRLLGRDPANYGNAGLSSIDLSASTSASTTRGATGNYSAALGRNTTAAGEYSIAAGDGSVVDSLAPYAAAIGYYCSASAPSTTAFGYYGYATAEGAFSVNSNATGLWSVSMGDYCTASGTGSVAMGRGTEASEDGSVALGANTTSINIGCTVVGSNNVGTSIDTKFEVGISDGSGADANGLEVYTDGTVTAPEATPAEITTRGAQALVTVDYLLSAEFGGSLPTSDVSLSAGQLWNDSGIVRVSTGGG